MPRARETPGGRVARAIHRVLKRKLHLARKGKVAQLEEELGYTKGSIRSWRQGGDLRTGDLFDILQNLKVDSLLFFREVLEEEGLIDEEEWRPLVDSIRTRFPPPAVLQTPPVPEEAPAVDIESLERQIFSDPATVANVLSAELSRRGCGESTVAELGVLGTSWRAMGRLSDSANAILLALRVATEDRTIARLLQRLSCVATADYHNTLGLLLVRASRDLFLLNHDLESVGRTFFDEARIHFNQKRMSLAKDYFEAALRHISCDDRIYQLSTRIGLGFAALSLGEVNLASRLCDQAASLVQGSDGRLAVRISWLKAGIALKRSDYPAAELLLKETILDFKAVGGAIDAALASIDLIEVLTEQGKTREATCTASEMMSLVFPLAEECSIAERAVMELYQAAQKSSFIRKEWLTEARSTIENGKRRTHICALLI